MKNPLTGQERGTRAGSSTAIIPRPSSVPQKLQQLRHFLEREALTNPTAAVLLLELGRTLAGAVAA